MPARSTSYRDFIAAVRRYRPTDVIDALRFLPIDAFEPGGYRDSWRTVNPWAAAAIVKVALVHGNEHRRPRSLSPAELNRLFALFADSHDELPDDPSTRLLSILNRLAYEQFESQTSIGEDLDRSILLFDDSENADSLFVRDVVAAELGMPLTDAVAAATVLFAATRGRNGIWAASEMEGSDVEKVTGVPASSITEFAERLTTNQLGFQTAVGDGAQPSHYSRWEFNPLRKTPLIRRSDRTVVAPIPWLIPRRLTPSVLYFAGEQGIRQEFTRRLGEGVQRYVGNLLNLVSGATVHPSVRWTGRNGEVESVDWFVHLPNTTLLIEVKSSRAFLEVRRGGPDASKQLRRDLGEAVSQLNATYSELQGENLALSPIHRDDAAIGLVVTAETFHWGNSPAVRSLLPEPLMPTLFLGLRELEMLVTSSASELEGALRGILDDEEKRRWDIYASYPQELRGRPNPLLQSASRRVGIFNEQLGSD